MKLKYLLPTLISILFVAACARQSSPTGGPKDTIPPKLVSTNPKNEQTNFSGSFVELEFNEFLNLNAAKEQIIITPSIGKEYKITSKKNTVTIDLNTNLDPNTTYTINFREAIQDITERNPVRNLKLAFSTGPYVDSLSIQGKVTDLLTTKELKDVTVALQHYHDTLNIVDYPSFYFTRSDEKGNFKLDYIKPGLYQLYAYIDKNKNLIVDPRNEAYGFIAKPINLEKDTTRIQIKTVKLDTRALKITSARPYNTYFNIKTNKYLTQHTITAADKRDLSYYYGEDQSNIRLYNTFPDKDSLEIRLIAADSSGSRIDTTMFAKFRKEQNIEKEKFTMNVAEASVNARIGTIKIRYTFNKPVDSFNLDSIYIRKDSLNTIRFSSNDVSWDSLTNSFSITKTVDKKLFLIEEPDTENRSTKPKDTTQAIKPINELLSRKAAFLSVEGDSSTSLRQKLDIAQPSSLSEIVYEVQTKNPSILVQLLNKEFKVLRQTTNNKGSFNDLPAGDYILRYVIDNNQNQRWDPGNYLRRQEPEKVYYAADPKGAIIRPLKANWTLELDPMLISD
ncbi:MAG TPA: Ig-like domain-containing domain [Chryseosolibacter sp.]